MEPSPSLTDQPPGDSAAPSPGSARGSAWFGLGLLLTASATFSTSGVFNTALAASGWSAAAALSIRLGGAALLLTVPALLALRGRADVLRRNARRLLAYGLIPIAAGQVAYFNALARLDVGVVLLTFNLGILWVVAWMWARHGQRPSPLVGIGAVLALVGVALVLDVLGRVRIDGIGLAWSLAGTVGLAAHYVLPANAHKDLPPIAMAWAGMGIGSIALITAGRSGLVPFATSNADVHLVGHPVGWAWPIAGLVVLAGVIPYVTVTTGIRRIGARLSSFVGLTEMIFAILLAWALLGQSLTASQLLGAALTIAGIALVRYAEGPTDRASSVRRQLRTKATRGPKSSRSAERSAAT